MSSKLVDACVAFPTFSSPPPSSNSIRSSLRLIEQRERDELLSRTMRIQLEPDNLTWQRDELEASILSLKKQLKSETQTLVLQRLFKQRIHQSQRAMDTPLAQVLFAERDDLVLEILLLQQKIRDAEFSMDQARHAESALLVSNQQERDEQEKKRARLVLLTNTDKLALLQERAALKHLLFVLIMESGVEWKEDQFLSTMVWSF